jgi:hypothetical protein
LVSIRVVNRSRERPESNTSVAWYPAGGGAVEDEASGCISMRCWGAAGVVLCVLGSGKRVLLASLLLSTEDEEIRYRSGDAR